MPCKSLWVKASGKCINVAKTLLSVPLNNLKQTKVFLRYEGGGDDRTPWYYGVKCCHVCEDVQRGRELLIRSAGPVHWAVCDGGDGRTGASWERCAHSPCVRCHSHDWSRAGWNTPERDRSSQQAGTGNLEGRIL